MADQIKPGDFYDGSPNFQPAPWLTDPNWKPPPPPKPMPPFEFNPNPELDFEPPINDQRPKYPSPFHGPQPGWLDGYEWSPYVHPDPFNPPTPDYNPWYHHPESKPNFSPWNEDRRNNAAAAGRFGDTEVAHLTKGEVVLPAEAAQKLRGQIERVMGKGSVPSRTVGSPEASVNPATGMEEFYSLDDLIDDVSDVGKEVVSFGEGVGDVFEGGWNLLTGKTQRQMVEAQRNWYNKQQKKIQTQYKKQQRDLERKLTKQMKAQEELAEKEKRETDKQIMKERIQLIQSKREMARTDLTAARGIAVGSGEAGIADPLSTSVRRYAPRRKRGSITSAAAPTLMVGSSYRPQ